jgi:hypothetical protein
MLALMLLLASCVQTGDPENDADVVVDTVTAGDAPVTSDSAAATQPR